MKIYVIGGTGNISTSLVRYLLEQGHEVTCVNRGQREAELIRSLERSVLNVLQQCLC